MALRRLVQIALGVVTALGLMASPLAGRVPLGPTAGHQVGSLTRVQWEMLSGSTEQALATLGIRPALAAEPAKAGDDVPLLLEDNPRPVRTNAEIGPPLGSPSGRAAPAAAGSLGNIYPDQNDVCRVVLGRTVRVNTDCQNASDADLHGRAQAHNETAIAVNPNNPDQVIGSSNDYRRGDGQCGAYFSQDGGNHWGGGLAPQGFIEGFNGFARQYWSTGGDTSVAWDSSGTAYLMCQVFGRGQPVSQDPDMSNALLVFRSANGGASWNFTGRAAVKYGYQTTLRPLADKPYMTIDNNPGSPYADRIYVVWTDYVGTTNHIMAKYSTDHGQTWSAPARVSTNSPVCVASVCSNDQFGDPVVAPDGTLYVAFVNNNVSNTFPENRRQILVARSGDGGATFEAPVRASYYYELPDCAFYTGQNAGRACVPVKNFYQPSFFRATNYPSMIVDPKDSSHVYVHFGSYLNQHSNEDNGCSPAGIGSGGGRYSGVTTAGACNNEILVTVSSDGGQTFTGTSTDPRQLPSVSPDSTFTDQFWQWSAITADGVPVVSYYDRQYDQDESTGFSDITVAANGASVRVTDTPNPPPSAFMGQFLGDYMGLAIGVVRRSDGSGSPVALPIWSDTRDIGITSCPADPRQWCQFGNQEDAFVGLVEVPGQNS